MCNVGILAYGSLIRDPGSEIEPLIVKRIPTQTPFSVEYARLSIKRGGGATVVPHPDGQTVKSEILLLKQTVSLPIAKDILWRRETGNEGTGKRYPDGHSPNSVLVKDWPQLGGISHVLYTDFPDAGKIANPNPRQLATAAVASVSKAPAGKDGISYLIQVSESGVETVLTSKYRVEILRIAEVNTLEEALEHLQRKTSSTSLDLPFDDQKRCQPLKQPGSI
ncbi:MAG: hypothetical protein PHV34_14820 [Verrucomicrobiae bacterium]|nr:hypothetical protein [Verrucomicrobiae bacterium]